MAKDEIPPGIKQVIIGAVDLCERVSTWTEHAMDKSKSYEQTIEKAYDVCVGASKLIADIRKVFTWKEIVSMMDDLGVGGQHVDLSKDKIILPDGSVVSVGPRLAEVLKKGEKKDGEEGKPGCRDVGDSGYPPERP